MNELEAILLEKLKNGEYNGFRVDYPNGYSSKRKSVDKGVYIKDGEIVEFTDVTTETFLGDETERTTERKTYIPETDEDKLKLLGKVGYKDHDHEELRQYSKSIYEERDRTRREEAERARGISMSDVSISDSHNNKDTSLSVTDETDIEYPDDDSDNGNNNGDILKVLAGAAGAAVGLLLLKKTINYLSPRIKEAKLNHVRPCPSCGKSIRKDHSDVWKCRKCGFSIHNSELENTVFWFCDSCGAFLNTQQGFSDKNETWTCSECGSENKITMDNIVS